MTKNQYPPVVGVFDDRGQAREAVRALRRASFPADRIGVEETDRGGAPAAGVAAAWKAAGGWAVRVGVGAGAGALWALGMAAGVLPAVGPAVPGGLLLSALVNAGGGAALAAL